MKRPNFSLRPGFTLLETVIAIGVLAVLLTGFMVVFAPAAEGIRKSINIQQADRLASTLERELVTKREGEPGSYATGFDKAFQWIKTSNTASDALLVYQYRGKIGSPPRADGTPTPESTLDGKLVGRDYVVVPMVRRKSDTANFLADLAAVEGAVYMVKCTQLIFDANGMETGTVGAIQDPKAVGAGGDVGTSDNYPEAVIAFSAEFFMLPAKSPDYFSGAFTTKFANFKNPVFTRNLAVRR